MGRHLLWRKAIITLIIALISETNLFAETKKRPIAYREKSDYQIAKSFYHHNWPKYYTIDIRIQTHPIIREEIKRMLTGYNKKDLQISLLRAQDYWHYIETRLADYKAPWELIYLPIVESHYDIYAVSVSGATGLWQFMQNSMHPWLKKNDWMDERRDFFKSTDAAIEKLIYNKKVTKDWLLAVAAYNAGLGKITRTIKDSNKQSYFELIDSNLLSSQTKHYVARLIAVSYIMSNKAKLGIPVNWPETVEWRTIETEKPVMLSLLADRCKIPQAEMEKANAELSLGISPPGHRIKVKAKYYDIVKTIINNKDIPLINVYIHTVRSGDTLSELARDYQVPLSLIYLYNPKQNPQKIKIGTKLIIPLISGNIKEKNNSIPANIKWITHTVEKGETLWAISRKYASKVEWISQANNITINSIIKPGMKLKIPIPKDEE